jgi:hypothetical protein
MVQVLESRTLLSGITLVENTAPLAANVPVITIQGTGFNATAANNTVAFTNAAGATVVTGTVIEANAGGTELLVRFNPVQDPPAGALFAVVTNTANNANNDIPVQVANVVPVVNFSVTTLNINAADPLTLTITGFGFDANPQNNSVEFDNGAVGIITGGTTTTLNVTFTVRPTTAGPLSAVVSTNGQTSGAAVQVARIAPFVTTSASPQPASERFITISGLGFDPQADKNLVSFNNSATGKVVSVNPAGTILTVEFDSGPVTAGKLTATVTTNGVNSGLPVQVATVTPVVTPSTEALLANSDKMIIQGFGFDFVTHTNNSVKFYNAAGAAVLTDAYVSDATATTLEITFKTKPTVAGVLKAVVTTNGQSSGPAAAVATVTPSVTPSTAPLAANAKTITINGFGFDPVASNNKVTFNNGAIGNVTKATSTSITVTLATAPKSSGPITAVVTTNGISSGFPVQVASVTPVVTPNTTPLSAISESIVIRGVGFDKIPANNQVTFNNGAVGIVTAVNSTGTAITVLFTTKPAVAGALTATVVVEGQLDALAPVTVANVTPAVASSLTPLAINATELTINGFGFDPVAGNNRVTFNNGAVGTVTAVNATGTSMTVALSTPPSTPGTMTAIVTTNNQKSGTAVAVANVVPIPQSPELTATLTALASPRVSTPTPVVNQANIALAVNEAAKVVTTLAVIQAVANASGAVAPVLPAPPLPTAIPQLPRVLPPVARPAPLLPPRPPQSPLARMITLLSRVGR